MESADIHLTLLGATADTLSLLIKQHEPTKTSFEIIRSQMQLFSDLLNQKTNDDVEIFQTGSSFDDLHLCRNMAGLDKEQLFFPPTDFDFMMVYKKFAAEDFTGYDLTKDKAKISTAMKTSKTAFLMVPTDHLGYVRLMVTDKGRDILKEKKSYFPDYIDDGGFLRNKVFRDKIVTDPAEEIIYSRKPLQTQYTASGPAISNLEPVQKGFSYDFVHAFPCREWPEVANRWSKRPRDSKWPDEKIVKEVMEDGCVVVPVGFYTSPDQEREWRLSFNLSERKLSSILTTNQRTCYCIVKLLIKAHLSPQAILSSYMVKNMMFWFCEQQYGQDEWESEYLGERIVQLVDYICTALEHHNIPQYILPFNNLIRHKTKEEVKLTLDEVRRLKATPFQTLAAVCRKMRVFDVRKDEKGVFTSGGEVQAMLTLFTCLVQSLSQLGLLNCDAPQLALSCFRTIVSLNSATKSLIRQSSNLFSATTIADLLKPFAIQFMQSGDVERALSLFLIMHENDRENVIRNCPETITNIACLYGHKMELMQEKATKDEFARKAADYFQLALACIADSPSLHLAYGNFLKDANISMIRAIEQFKKAIDLDRTREDDDALIQITLPGTSETPQAKPVYVPGKVVAYYSLVDALVGIDDIYKARKIAQKFEAFVSKAELKIRKNGLELCAHSFARVGLHVKSALAMAKSKKIKFT